MLGGLGHRLPALSFEFTTMQRRLAFDCLRRLTELGDYRFDAALGESQCLVFGEPIDAAGLSAWLTALPNEANSGDVYATLVAKQEP